MRYKLTFILLLSYSVSFTQNLNELDESEYYQSKLKILTSEILVDSSKSNLFCERGIINSELKNYQNALKDFNKAIELDSTNFYAYNHRALFYYKFGYIEFALQDNNQALKYVEENDTLKYGIICNRGVVKLMSRDFEGAYSDFLMALSFDSSDVDILVNLGAVLDNLGRDMEAIDYLEKAIRLNPQCATAYANLAFRHMDLGNYQKALELNNKAIELNEFEPIPYNNRAFVHYKMGNYTEALIDVNKSINMYPSNSFAYKNRALIYIAMNKINLACNDINKALDYGFTGMYGNEAEELKKRYCNKN